MTSTTSLFTAGHKRSLCLDPIGKLWKKQRRHHRPELVGTHSNPWSHLSHSLLLQSLLLKSGSVLLSKRSLKNAQAMAASHVGSELCGAASFAASLAEAT